MTRKYLHVNYSMQTNKDNKLLATDIFFCGLQTSNWQIFLFYNGFPTVLSLIRQSTGSPSSVEV